MKFLIKRIKKKHTQTHTNTQTRTKTHTNTTKNYPRTKLNLQVILFYVPFFLIEKILREGLRITDYSFF